MAELARSMVQRKHERALSPARYIIPPFPEGHGPSGWVWDAIRLAWRTRRSFSCPPPYFVAMFRSHFGSRASPGQEGGFGFPSQCLRACYTAGLRPCHWAWALPCSACGPAVPRGFGLPRGLRPVLAVPAGLLNRGAAARREGFGRYMQCLRAC